MADKTYVCVAKMGVTNAFDNKYKTSLPNSMKATVEKAINSSRSFTTKPPTDKNATGFYMDGNLVSLDKTEKGQAITLSAQMSMQLAEWPKKSMFGFLKGEGKIPNANPKDLDGDVRALVESVLSDLVNKKVIPALEARGP
jgi:hypothetical protein